MMKCPRSTDIKSLRIFFLKIYFYATFIKSMIILDIPLYEKREYTKYQWNEDMENSFNKRKE